MWSWVTTMQLSYGLGCFRQIFLCWRTFHSAFDEVHSPNQVLAVQHPSVFTLGLSEFIRYCFRILSGCYYFRGRFEHLAAIWKEASSSLVPRPANFASGICCFPVLRAISSCSRLFGSASFFRCCSGSGLSWRSRPCLSAADYFSSCGSCSSRFWHFAETGSLCQHPSSSSAHEILLFAPHC